MYCSRLIKGLSGNEVTSENHIGNLNKIRYRGYYQDTETGFYYLMSRYYDPVTHRFLNADGYFQTGTGMLDTNMSAYCLNNPVNYFDPTGTITAKQIQYELAFNHDTTKYTIADALEQQKRDYYAATGRAHPGPRKDKRKGSENRQPTNNRERNVGHPNGEEHSRVAKGTGGIKRSETIDIMEYLPKITIGMDWSQVQVPGVPDTGDKPIYEKIWDDIIRLFGG